MAADPKYANLPGIAYDQPDIYESGDLPEADQFHGDEQYADDDNSVEPLDISTHEAFSRFKGKTVIADGVDFSDRLSRKPRTGYHVRSGEWELVGAGDKETPLQRYQRLKIELKELQEEISALKDEDIKDYNEANVVNNVGNMVKELESVKLEKCLGPAFVSQLSDPQGAQIKKLLLSLETLRTTGGGSDVRAGNQLLASSVPGTGSGTAGLAAEISYSVQSNPAQSALSSAARLADLEARLGKLQTLLNTSPSAIKRLGGSGDKSLAETAHWIAGKVAMLEPGQVEVAETKITALLGRLDQLTERSAQLTGSTDMDNKISELYELVKGTEEMSLVIPSVLDRMLALEELYKHSNDFSKSITELESTQQILQNSCEACKELVKKLEEQFASSIKTLKTDIESLSERMKAIQGKK